MGMRTTKQKAAESTMIFKAVDNHKTHGQDKWDANVRFKDAKKNFTSKKKCNGTEYVCMCMCVKWPSSEGIYNSSLC